MRLVLVVLVCLLVCGCDRNQKESKLSSEKERLSDDVLRSAASKLLNEKNLILCATGGGMLDQVRMLALSFDYRRPVTITEARGLLIASVQELLDDINTHQLLRPYLHNYPFTPTNVEIRIFLQNVDGSVFGQGELCSVSAIDRKLIYRAYVSNQLIDVYEETYAQALREIEGRDADLSRF